MSQHLSVGDNGEELTLERLRALAEHYGTTITCLSLMGGDNDPRSVLALLARIREEYPHLHTGWYSGRDQLPLFSRNMLLPPT